VNTWYHSWRVALRIARRDAWRFKGRSFLVLAMIALPILGVSAADLTLRSSELSPEQKLDRAIGRADAELRDPGFGGVPVLQGPDPIDAVPTGNYDNKPYPVGHTDIGKVLPPGATTLEQVVGKAKLRTTHGLLNADVHELKAADPLARGIMTLKNGRFPAKADEVAATTHFLQTSGLRVGSKLTARGLAAPYDIVGAYELPDELAADEVNPLPGALLAPLGKVLEAEGLSGSDVTTTQLISVPGGFSWDMVNKANTQGVTVFSRAVTLHPPADSEVALYREHPRVTYGGGSKSTEHSAAATIVGLAMLEICLLAGPAFAVGARRSRRQLGLVGANGGDRRDIRAVVVSGGLVIGVASAVIGTVLGLGLTVALRPTLEEYVGARFGGLTVRPLELLGIALLAVLTGMLAAIAPAVTASRQPVLASLTGRKGVRRSSRVLPVLGLLAFLLGAAVALYGSLVSDQSVIVAGGSGIAELGVVAMTPVLVGLFGRLSRWLPLSPRLALRDSVRNRGRTAPAVAAVLAAVAGTVAVATYSASTDAQSRAEYVPQLPRGVISATLYEDRGRDVPALRTAVEQNLPVDVRADVDQISVTKPGCANGACGEYEIVVPPANRCPLNRTGPNDPRSTMSTAQLRALAGDRRCKTDSVGSSTIGGVLVGDAKLLTVLGIKDPAAAGALAKGQVVSFDRANVGKDHQIAIRLITDLPKAEAAQTKGQEAPGEIKKLAAYQTPGEPDSYGISMIVPRAAATSAGIPTVPFGAYYSTTSMPTGAQQQKMAGVLDETGNDVQFHLEQGYVNENDIVLLALAVFAGLVTIGAAGIATGLAQADAEADLSTLAAIGAPARVRRTLSGFQCGVVAGMGVLLGSAAGVLPAIGLRLLDRRSAQAAYQQALDSGQSYLTIPHVAVVLPWGTLAGLLIAVPLGAALLAALVTRSHPMSGRRAVS
jgi:putative ABC transport system permease protein